MLIENYIYLIVDNIIDYLGHSKNHITFNGIMTVHSIAPPPVFVASAYIA